MQFHVLRTSVLWLAFFLATSAHAIRPGTSCDQLLMLPGSQALRLIYVATPTGASFHGAFVEVRAPENPAPKDFSATFARGSLADAFVAQIREDRLISQSDPWLVRRGHAIPNGGLCTTTCGANVLSALVRFTNRATGHATASSPVWVENLIRQIALGSGKDARLGLPVGELALPLAHLAANIGVRIVLEPKTRNQFGRLRESDLALAYNEVAVVSLRVDRELSHAVVVLHLKPETREIWYFDPNRPRELYRANYSADMDTDGRPTLRVGVPVQISGDRRAGLIEDVLIIGAMDARPSR